MTKKFIFILFLIAGIVPVSFSEGNRILYLPFTAPYALNKTVKTFNQLSTTACNGMKECMTAKDNTWYPFPSGTLSMQQVKNYDSLLLKNNCSSLVMGSINKQKNGLLINAFLYNSNSKIIIYSTSEFVESESDLPVAVKSLFTRFKLVINNKMPAVSEIKATHGGNDKSISLSWKCQSLCERYHLYRSNSRYGLYELISKDNKDTYIDKTAEEGIKYFYKIIPENNGVFGEADYTWGYIKPKNPQGLTPDDVLDDKNKGCVNPVIASEKFKYDRHITLMEEFYEGYLTMSFIILVGKIYVRKGELIIYRDFNRYSLDKNNKTIYLYKPGMSVKFVSKRFFRFMRHMDEMKIPEQELIPRLVINGIIFCMREGETEITGNDGITRFIPAFEAVGFSTEYCKDYKNWRSNTVIFGSSDKELDKRIKDAKNKGY